LATLHQERHYPRGTQQHILQLATDKNKRCKSMQRGVFVHRRAARADNKTCSTKKRNPWQPTISPIQHGVRESFSDTKSMLDVKTGRTLQQYQRRRRRRRRMIQSGKRNFIINLHPFHAWTPKVYRRCLAIETWGLH
jgi:hypothetical protein